MAGSVVGRDHSAEITIRRATPADAAAIAPLLGELGYASSADDTSRRLTVMADDDHVAVFVAMESDHITGVATVQYLSVLHASEPVAQLMLLVVAETHRRRGVGRVLTDAAERWASERGCTHMLVVTGLQRADAHAFYETLGYHHTARRYVKRLG